MSERKGIRFGIRWGKFALVYERVIDKLKPVKQVEVREEDKPKRLKKGGIDIYV